jgi:hypothetical protein
LKVLGTLKPNSAKAVNELDLSHIRGLKRLKVKSVLKAIDPFFVKPKNK